MFSKRKVKASHNSAQVKHVYESYFSLLKNLALSEVQRYVFDSLLKHQLHVTRDNTFAEFIIHDKDMWIETQAVIWLADH